MKRSIEEEKNAYMEANDKESIFELIEQVIGLGIKNDKKGQVKKGHSKPKVRYFCVKIGELSIEIVTSSHTSINFRDRNTQVEMLNHIVYSKLPNILQSSTSQKHLILTLNPIVDLYEECRNTLSASLPRTTTQIS